MSAPLCRRSLIACHLPKHKPPVCSRMTEWHVAIGDQRHTPAEPSRVYPEELGHMLFRNRQSTKEIFTVLPRFLDDLLQSEDLVRSTATRTKTALDNLQFWFHYFFAFSFEAFGIYFPWQTKKLYPPVVRASERKFFRGYEGQYWAPKSYWAPQASSGPMPLNHFLSDGCRSSFKSEGITIFAYSWTYVKHN